MADNMNTHDENGILRLSQNDNSKNTSSDLEFEKKQFENEKKKYENDKKEFEQQVYLLNVQKANAYRKFQKEGNKKALIKIRSIMIILFVGCIVYWTAHNVVEKKETLYSELEQDFISQKQDLAESSVESLHTLWDQVKSAIIETEKSTDDSLGISSTIINNNNRTELNQYIASLDRKLTQAKAELKQWYDIPYYKIRKVEKYDIDEYVISDPGNDTIFPGSIIRGDSLFQGVENYTQISLERSPMYLTSTNGDGTSRLVSNISYRTVSNALYDFQQKSNNFAQEWTYSLKSITTSEEFKFTFGVEAAAIGLDLGYNTSTSHSTTAIVYNQTYYTVNAEPLNNAIDYFKDGVDISAIGSYEPVYVSSVDYGRKIVVFVSGNMSSEELSAKLDACLEGVSINAGLSNVMSNEELNVQIFQIGGKANNVNNILGESNEKANIGIKGWWNNFWNGSETQDSLSERINDFLDMDGELVNPVPLSYKLKYLSDNAVVPTVAIVQEQETIIPAQMIKLSGSSRDNLERILQMDLNATWNLYFEEKIRSVLDDTNTFQID